MERDDWDRSGGRSYSSYAYDHLSSLGALNSCTSRFVNPNAKCPVCGEDVFFYQNEFGSRVYFDELGPPWPKHPCTDNQDFSISRKSGSGNFIVPALRDGETISDIVFWIEQAEWDVEEEFFEEYSSRPWGCWRLLRRVKGVAKTLLLLSAVDEDRLMYLAANRLPKALKNGTVVFYKRLRLAYFDCHSMEPKECTVERLKGAKEFIYAQFGI